MRRVWTALVVMLIITESSLHAAIHRLDDRQVQFSHGMSKVACVTIHRSLEDFILANLRQHSHGPLPIFLLDEPQETA